MHWPPSAGSESTSCERSSCSPSWNIWNSPTGPAPTTTASVSIAAVGACFVTRSLGRRSADQLAELAGLVFPLVGIGLRRLALRDARPTFRELGVQRDHVLLVAWHVFFRDDRVDRAFGDADRAVDALVRVDRQEIRAFAEAVDRTHIDA